MLGMEAHQIDKPIKQSFVINMLDSGCHLSAQNKCMNKVQKELSGRVVVSQCYS